MAKKIALFNHKGGVSKTTTTFNLGWALAEHGRRVILVDADPQCNLTGLILGYKKYEEIQEFYEKKPQSNIKAALSPAFEAKPCIIEAAECVPVNGQEDLFLLPGHIGLSEYDVTLGIAQELSGAIQTLKNLPGSINYMLQKTAEKYKADYLLIDMSPSLSSINQNLLMTSEYFIVPTSPDFYSVMAIDSLSTMIRKWSVWAKVAGDNRVLKEASYVFPSTRPKFLGTIIQKFRLRGGAPSRGFEYWVDAINEVVVERLFKTLLESELVLGREKYGMYNPEPYCLSMISDFNTLIARSQETQTPVFALSADQIAQQGVVLSNSLESVETFRRTFCELSRKIEGLTS
jgi:cellulose biosynthesis protein BcsQ